MATVNNPYGNGMYGFNPYAGFQYPSVTPAPSYQPQSLVVGWANSENDARNSYVEPGRSSYFMDKNLPAMYLKSVDQSGHVSDFKIYDLVERVQEQKPSAEMPEIKEYVASLVAQAMADAGWKTKKKEDK